MKSDNWIDDCLSEVSHVETPRSWLWWSLVTALSACSTKYYVRSLKGTLTYTPNIYVILLGGSGLGKGFPINLSKLLVKAANCTRVIAGRSSIQAIVTELGTFRSQASKNGAEPILDSRGFIVNGELSSAIIADVDSLAILTDLYDGKDNAEWTNRLKISGTETLKEPYITALFGSSPAHFYDSIPEANIRGGYIGRNLVVFEERRHKNVDLFEDDDEVGNEDVLRDIVVPRYAKHLQSIAKGGGRILLNHQSKELINSWRTKWRSEQNVNEPTGFVSRVPDHVIKVSMLMSLSRYASGGIIQPFDIEEAIEKVTTLIYANRMTGESKPKDPFVVMTKLVIDSLIAAPENKLTRRQILSKNYGSGLDSMILDRITDNLLEIGYVKKERLLRGTQTDFLFYLAGEPLERYLEWKRTNLK